MNELYSAAEILNASTAIKAATIQADATIEAAWWAAGGIIVGLIASWRTGLSLQKKSRVAEIRREIYVEVVAAYSRMNCVIASMCIEPKTALNRLLDAVEQFTVSIDKAMFVCETTTKAEIVNFYHIFIPVLAKIYENLEKIIDKYDDLEFEKTSHDKVIEQLSVMWDKLDEFSIDNSINEKIKNALDLIDSKIDRSNLIIERIKTAENLFIEERKAINYELHDLFSQLNDKALDVMYSLRLEIGIKNNKPLDKILNEKLKILADPDR